MSLMVAALMLAALPGIAGAASTPQTALAPLQQGSEVTYDTPVQGTVTNDTPSQDWTFTSQSADRIDVRVERTDGNLIPNVTLLDNNGQEITQSYGADYTYAVAEISNFTLPQANTYTIHVERRDAASGTTTGGYSLTVTLLGVGADHPNNTAVVGPIQFDTPVTGEITASHWQYVYTLDAEEGDYISVTSQRVDGTLIPEVSVVDSNGQELTHGYASNTYDSATTGSYG
jgi:hypothetical protein